MGRLVARIELHWHQAAEASQVAYGGASAREACVGGLALESGDVNFGTLASSMDWR